MRWGVGLSFTLHAAILLAAVVVLPEPDAFKVEDQESIPVDIVSIDELSKRMATSTEEPPADKKPAPVKTEKKIEKIAPKAADKVKQVAKEQPKAKPQPKPEPQVKPEPVPEPVPEPKQAEAKPEPLDSKPLDELIKTTEPEPQAEPEPKQAEAKPVPLPRKKPAPPKKVAKTKPETKPTKPGKSKEKFDPDQLAALLNKMDGESTTTTKNQTVDGAPTQADKNRSDGFDDKVTATELEWLRQRVGMCWNMPAGVENARGLVVKVQFSMDLGGNVTGQPAVVNSSSDPRFDAAARSAVAAILGCQPYNMLPVEKFNSWHTIRMNFDPSKMLALN